MDSQSDPCEMQEAYTDAWCSKAAGHDGYCDYRRTDLSPRLPRRSDVFVRAIHDAKANWIAL